MENIVYILQYYELFTTYPQVVNNFITTNRVIIVFFWEYTPVFYAYINNPHTFPRYSHTYPQTLNTLVDKSWKAQKNSQIDKQSG